MHQYSVLLYRFARCIVQSFAKRRAYVMTALSVFRENFMRVAKLVERLVEETMVAELQAQKLYQK